MATAYPMPSSDESNQSRNNQLGYMNMWHGGTMDRGHFIDLHAPNYMDFELQNCSGQAGRYWIADQNINNNKRHGSNSLEECMPCERHTHCGVGCKGGKTERRLYAKIKAASLRNRFLLCSLQESLRLNSPNQSVMGASRRAMLLMIWWKTGRRGPCNLKINAMKSKI